jgi:uncharacterized protein
VEGSERQREAAAETVRSLCARYEIEAVAIGNGTASRETEAFVRGLGLPRDVLEKLYHGNAERVIPGLE